MKHTGPAVMLLFLICFVCAVSFAQSDKAPLRGYAVEVTYMKGRPLAYQFIGQGSWYGAFGVFPDWKQKMGEIPVNAVRIAPRDDAGVVKAKVSVLRGDNHEVEDFVGEYVISEKKTLIEELVNFGIVPFEVKLVRAPTTVAELPVVTNNTKSLVASTEPTGAVLPAFKARFLNNSAKPVTGFAYRTSVNDRTKIIAMPQDRTGGTLIEPGATYSLTLRYPTDLTTESTGEVPQAMSGVQLNILAVMFADGSFEGDRIQAARFRGYKLGEKIELTRLLNLLRSASAATPETLAVKVEELPYKIAKEDVAGLVAEFPGLPEPEIENMRSAAEVSASDILKSFKSTFGKGGSANAKIFADAVKGAISKCEKWLDSLP